MAASLAEVRPTILTHLSQVQRLVTTYQQRDPKTIYFDTETTGLDPSRDKLVTLQFKQHGFPAVALDVRQMALGPLAELLLPLFSVSYLFVGHNLKFDLGFLLASLGVIAYRTFDTMLAEQVLHGLGREDAKKKGVSLSLAATAKRHLDIDLPKEERAWFVGLDTRPREWHAPLPDEQIRYALRDIEVLEPLMEAQLKQLRARSLVPVVKLENRALPAIAAMEHAGMRINVAGWREVIAKKEGEALQHAEAALQTFGPAILMYRAQVWAEKQREYEAWELARDEEERRCREEFDRSGGGDPGTTGFLPWGKWKIRWMQQWREEHPNPGRPKPDTSPPNLGSSKQMVEAFHILKIPVPKKRRPNGTFTPSLDSDALEPLKETYPEVATLLLWRGAQKFVDSFGEGLLQFVNPEDSRIHPEYQQIGASTGRMSCTKPNLQQIPSRSPDAKLLRANVVAAPGHKLLVADYSGIEMRILADQSRDEALCGVFAKREDIHTATARMMFDLPEHFDVANTYIPGSDVTYRAAAKQLNYMLMYGGGAKKLARKLGCALALAEELMGRYFALYAGVEQYLSSLKKLAVRTSEAVTISGRKRYFTVPAEPVFPFSEKNDPRRIAEWREAHREWEFVRARIERQGMNHPIQGTNADMIKLAMALFHEREVLPHLRESGVAKLIAAVHDELVVEAREEEAGRVAEVLADCMDEAQHYFLTHVTLERPEVHIGDYWAK